MLQLLQRLVEEDPTRSDSWRLIGRIHQKNGQLTEALAAFSRALETQPDNIAAHFDLAELLTEAGKEASANGHYDMVMKLGPDSSYAAELVERGLRPAVSAATQTEAMPENATTNAAYWESIDIPFEEIEQAGFQIQTFDGSDDLLRRLQQLDADAASDFNHLRAFVELGTMYNTNVSLTPISRELTGGKAASAQLFLSPEVEWIAVRHDSWRIGPLARGYFTVNESSFESLNLASFQPGSFIERDFLWGESQLTGRLDYVYSLDFLDAERFADRHAVTASLTNVLPDSDVVYSYLTTSYSDFANDGIDPDVDSLDGISVTAGVSRFFRTDWQYMPTWSLGADFEHADTQGDDYRYTAVTLHGDTTIQLLESVSFIPTFGVGYRDYGDFTGAVNRDELTWRAGARLKWQVRPNLSISAIIGHDRFASDNEQFDTQRTQAGIVATFMH